MTETDVHWRQTVRTRSPMEWRHRKRRVYVGSDLFVYYKQGDTEKRVAPDVTVWLCAAASRYSRADAHPQVSSPQKMPLANRRNARRSEAGNAEKRREHTGRI